ncbi:MAG: hybrid sensor histidine kinase/response regulator [Desulfobacteraceae bacterium]|nr:MAG: hybrid sensor histidine kinase/response regulator [Desulfobacteraceae bacterium]
MRKNSKSAKRVLTVDDSRSVRTVLRQALEEGGYSVVEAKNGREAMDAIRSFTPDLITMDVQMPEMDGFEATALIRKQAASPELPIVFVTAKDTLEDRERGFALGAIEFISKKIANPVKEVRLAVDRILRREAPLERFTILVAEKEGMTRRLLVNALKQEGGRILETDCGQEAFTLLSTHRNSIDLVITDRNFPDMSGEGICKIIRQKLGLRHIPIIFLCSAGEKKTVLEMFRAGATDYILKPFVKEEVMARIISHLEMSELVKGLSTSVLEQEKLHKLRDEFMAISSHDLKSPLSSIMGYASLLESECPLSEEHRSWLEAILKSSQLMLDIVNDYVELGKNASLQDGISLEPVALIPVIKVAVTTNLQTARSKGVSLALASETIIDPQIEGNPNQILRILNNLLSNAIKFTDGGGSVNIEVRVSEEEVHLFIRDTGIGIPQNILSSLFDRFTKVSRRGTAGEPGTGLGMSITKQLVDRHGGTIEVESAVGKGSCFHLCFPLL